MGADFLTEVKGWEGVGPGGPTWAVVSSGLAAGGWWCVMPDGMTGWQGFPSLSGRGVSGAPVGALMSYEFVGQSFDLVPSPGGEVGWALLSAGWGYVPRPVHGWGGRFPSGLG